MATITGFTSSRMKQIEDTCIVNGAVVLDDLVLTRRDGTSINAGNVRGPKGDTGATGATGAAGAPASSNIAYKPSTDPPSSYPTGIRIFSVSTEADWPSTLLTVTTVKWAASRVYQEVVKKLTGEVWIRAEGDNDAWGPWSKLTTKSYVDSLIGGIELGATVDLNTLVTAGVYTQASDSEAAGGINYPTPYSGVLEVSNIGTMVWQTYTPYYVNAKSFYKRGLVSGLWSPWYRYDSAQQRKPVATELEYAAGYTKYEVLAPAALSRVPEWYIIDNVCYVSGGIIGKSTTVQYNANQLYSGPFVNMPEGTRPKSQQLFIGEINYSTGAGPLQWRVNPDGAFQMIPRAAGTLTGNATNGYILFPSTFWLLP